MHVEEKDEKLLEAWIIRKLESSSDADSDVLGAYVLALAKASDGSSSSRANFIDSLRDFLGNKTEAFVDELFQAVSTKSYDPSRPIFKPPPPIYQPPSRSNFEPPYLQASSRKRSYRDWDEVQPMHGHVSIDQHPSRSSKYARRDDRAQEFSAERHPSRQKPQYGAVQLQQLPKPPTPPPGMPSLDPQTAMATIWAMQHAMGFFPNAPNRAAFPNSNGARSVSNGQRCRDYDLKGFCAAGASCPYEHGNDLYVVPGSNEEYDPNHASLLTLPPNRVGHINNAHSQQRRDNKKSRGHSTNNFRGGGKRAPFSHIGPNRNSSVTSIVVEQIPVEKCDEQSVHDFFSQFGNIQEIVVQPQENLAIVKYDNYQAARAAYESPTVVFDNRFVKVYWHRPEKDAITPTDPVNGMSDMSNVADVEMEEVEGIDLDAFHRRQEEAQRKHEETQKQREQAAKQRQDLDAKLRAIEAERKQISDLIAQKSGRASSPIDDPNVEIKTEENESTKTLKAQLAKLEAEAKSLGIDPEAPVTNGYGSYSPHYRGRGAYRGRGRSRGFYNSYRGGWPGNSGAVMRLDNRSKTLAVAFASGADYSSHDEALRQFLLFNSLDSASLEKHPSRNDAALITFEHRFEGENFMQAAVGSEIPHIGKVDMSWYKPEVPSTSSIDKPRESTKLTGDAAQAQVDLPVAPAEEEDFDRWS